MFSIQYRTNKTHLWQTTIALIILISLCLLLTACGSNKTEPAKTLRAKGDDMAAVGVLASIEDDAFTAALSQNSSVEHHTVFRCPETDTDYAFALLRDIHTDELLEDSNVIYFDEGSTDENGILGFDYYPRSYDQCFVCLFGQLSQAAAHMTWTVSDNGALRITGVADLEEYSSSHPAPWSKYKDQITVLNCLDDCTCIPDYAFAGLSGITSLTLPDSIREIGAYAFDGCSSLRSVTINGYNTSFDPTSFERCSPELTIFGHSDSNAEICAQFAGINFSYLDYGLLLGDADGNGNIAITDVTWIQRFLAEYDMPDSFSEKASDVDGDGDISVTDVTYIQRYLAEYPVPYPINEYVT